MAVAVVQASSCSSKWNPSLGTSICRGGCPIEEKKTQKSKSETCPNQTQVRTVVPKMREMGPGERKEQDETLSSTPKKSIV